MSWSSIIYELHGFLISYFFVDKGILLCCRKHTVFGKLVVGSDVLKRIEQVDVQSPDSTPAVPVTIVNCGELTDRKDFGSTTIEIGNALIGIFAAPIAPFNITI